MEAVFKNFQAKGLLFTMVLFSLLAVAYPYLREADTFLSLFLYDASGPFIDQFFIVITILGSAKVAIPLLLLLLILCLIKRKIWLMFALAFDAAGVRLLNSAFKSFFKYERPEWPHLVEASGYTFPSGHAMNTTAFFGFLAFLICCRFASAKKWRYAAAFFLLVFIFLVGISRVYLGVHYLLDVAAGFLAGSIWLIVTIYVYQLKQKKLALFQKH